VGVHHPRRHADGRHLLAVAAEHPIAACGRKATRSSPFVEECKKGAVMEADLAQIEKKGMPTGMFVTHPLTARNSRSGSATTCSWATAKAR
jgi:leucyl-tRNA synthetase